MTFDLDIAKSFGPSPGFRLSARLKSATDRLVLFGPSGSGKSVTLQAMAGLIRPDAGRIAVGGRVFFDSARRVDLPTRKRNIGYLFQDYALFPHLSVRDNVAFGLAPPFGRLTRPARRAVEDLLERFGLMRVAGLRPLVISGGQRQRTALARAVIREPEALLLDEPFSALDIPLREAMRRELDQLASRLGIPMVLVTHDPEDVRVLAREAAVYESGEVVRMMRDREVLRLDGFCVSKPEVLLSP
jgi:molybdate transport system ATP-binding protein